MPPNEAATSSMAMIAAASPTAAIVPSRSQ
jgi:hypothetical protein